MHTDPDNSMTGDGVQSLFPDQFANLLQDLEKLAPIVGKTFNTAKQPAEFFPARVGV
jgi:3-deoxy-7-phosphoheptulonate synthase